MYTYGFEAAATAGGEGEYMLLYVQARNPK